MVRQVMFDGFERANQIYRDAARLDATALNLLERSESVDLLAVEAYIDVRRHLVLRSIAWHNECEQTRSRAVPDPSSCRWGKALASDVDQARERLLAARSVSEDVKWALDEAYAKFHEVVGLRAKGIRAVKRPRGLPRTRRTAVSIAVNNSPAVRAANTSIDAAKFERERAGGAYAPQIFAECCATYGRKIGGTPPRHGCEKWCGLLLEPVQQIAAPKPAQ